jgi:hypothetical protein
VALAWSPLGREGGGCCSIFFLIHIAQINPKEDTDSGHDLGTWELCAQASWLVPQLLSQFPIGLGSLSNTECLGSLSDFWYRLDMLEGLRNVLSASGASITVNPL